MGRGGKWTRGTERAHVPSRQLRREVMIRNRRVRGHRRQMDVATNCLPSLVRQRLALTQLGQTRRGSLASPAQNLGCYTKRGNHDSHQGVREEHIVKRRVAKPDESGPLDDSQAQGDRSQHCRCPENGTMVVG